jgi:TatD DNase family protein
MKLIDTHCHLFSEEFDNDREQCIRNAEMVGIEKILLPNIDVSSIQRLYETEQTYPNRCFAMMGLHPTSVNQNYEKELVIIHQELQKREFIGIGEIGMDLYWDKTFLKEQKMVFKTQLEWAVKYDYPVSIHCRDAFDEIFSILSEMPQLPKGVFHCFTGTLEQAQKIIQYQRFKLGIGGVITFKKSTLPEVLKAIDGTYFVLETDAPYLAPAPYRGKRNEPAYIKIIAEKLAQVKQVSIDDIIQQCYQNTLSIFTRLQE